MRIGAAVAPRGRVRASCVFALQSVQTALASQALTALRPIRQALTIIPGRKKSTSCEYAYFFKLTY